MTAAQYGEFRCAIFDEQVRRGVGRVYMQMFDVAPANQVGALSSLRARLEPSRINISASVPAIISRTRVEIDNFQSLNKHPPLLHLFGAIDLRWRRVN